ncbi:cation:proton antiporter, partial [Streptomyces sp. NPDC048845]|uniref:cation:proton antiporter n=1 Tax=Streptomyces sp. NPDC048845 TaxID=3155390 RepID=UPI003444BBD7
HNYACTDEALVQALVEMTGERNRGWWEEYRDPPPASGRRPAVAMSITAVPVLARILTDRGMSGTAAGGLALGSAITIDALGWLGLTVALGLGAGDAAGALRAAAALALGAAGALTVRYAMRTRAGRRLPARLPRTAALLLAAVALLVSFGMEHLGMTAVLGAAMVGFAIPRDKPAPWAGAAASVGRAGRALAPAFFVVTGITVLDESLTSVPWPLIVAAVVLGCLGKGVGGYLGARLGGCSSFESRQIGVLMNSRGLTELIVLQAGLSAGLLTEALVLALIVMAVTTTVMTGPLLMLLDRTAAPAPRRVPVPTESGV